MTVWYKEGVLGDLNPGIRRAKRKITKYFAARGLDLYITSKREGTHGAGSCHPEGDALDFRKPTHVDKYNLENLLGEDYDVVEHETHFHVEYDPK
jgi:hypothetical protein